MPYKNKEDQRAAWRRHYYRNRDKYIKRSLDRARENRALIKSLKIKCIKCGFDNPAALHFHHRDRSNKTACVSELAKWSKKRVLEEIDKCDVICANCHAVHHDAE